MKPAESCTWEIRCGRERSRHQTRRRKQKESTQQQQREMKCCPKNFVNVSAASLKGNPDRVHKVKRYMDDTLKATEECRGTVRKMGGLMPECMASSPSSSADTVGGKFGFYLWETVLTEPVWYMLIKKRVPNCKNSVRGEGERL